MSPFMTFTVSLTFLNRVLMNMGSLEKALYEGFLIVLLMVISSFLMRLSFTDPVIIRIDMILSKLEEEHPIAMRLTCSENSFKWNLMIGTYLIGWKVELIAMMLLFELFSRIAC